LVTISGAEWQAGHEGARQGSMLPGA